MTNTAMPVANPGTVFERIPHPETHEGEIFLCNADENEFAAIGWSSKRKGVRLDGDVRVARGRHREDYFPVFVQISELREAGRETRRYFGLE